MSGKKFTRAVEEELAIPTPDKKKIYTTVGYPTGKPKGMVIFVHGLASTALWPTMLLGSWYFRKKGYAYCRINLYDWRPGARSLMSSDLLQHARDTDTVAKYFKRKGFTNLFAVGHSFGGLTLLQSNSSLFNAISLWDLSSFISYPPQNWLKKDKKTGATYMPGGYELLISDRFKRGMLKFPNELTLISKMQAPCQICYASGKRGMLIESSARYFERLPVEKELIAIPDASHSFTEEGKMDVLGAKTEKWFRRYR